MKRLLTLTSGLALLLLTGCITLSVYPYYTSKDVIFDSALLGDWIEEGETNAYGQVWTFEKINERAYRFTVSGTDKEKFEFDAHLFKLKGHTFLDCLRRDREPDDFTVPGHFLLRVDRLQPMLEVHALDYEWLDELIEKNPKAIRHALIPKAGANGNESEDLVLTASTAELQKFILKHVQDEDAWVDLEIMQRR